MKRLTPRVFDARKCRSEWNDFDQLIHANLVLDENKHILPFFKTRPDLSLLISLYFPRLMRPDVFAHEYQIYGDFRADLVVGDSAAHNYLLVEFENGRPDSIFKKNSKATPDWAPRFEGAFSQLLDWLWKLDDMRSTADFGHAFGDRQAKFHGLIVIGKGMSLDAREKSRLKWREEKVIVDSNAISFVSFDQLSSDLNAWLTRYYSV
ncbi:MAG: Shedu immune nuclease family protein [Candidatus Sulfotelmatobacter sp.]